MGLHPVLSSEIWLAERPQIRLGGFFPLHNPVITQRILALAFEGISAEWVGLFGDSLKVVVVVFDVVDGHCHPFGP